MVTIDHAWQRLIAFLIFSDEAEALAKKLKLRFYRTSVKEDLNVKEGMHWARLYYVADLVETLSLLSHEFSPISVSIAIVGIIFVKPVS